MEKINLSGNMLGMTYPFFLNNGNLNVAHYLYQIVSPGLSPDGIPQITLDKISEKTKNDPSESTSDILTVCIGHKASDDEMVNYLEGIFKRSYPAVFADVYGNDGEFPLIDMEEGLGIQKNLIVGLRDSLRWKNYRFYGGRYIDVLWTPTEFIVFKICDDEKYLWLEPVSVHKNSDISLTNPLDVDFSKVEGLPVMRYTKEADKISKLNRFIKTLEWASFDRKSFK